MAIKHEKDETPKAPKETKEAKLEKVEYLSKFTVYHPFQKVRIEPGVATPLYPDAWVEAQLKAGILKEV